MAKSPPAFQFYANDFMDATSSWEANAVGLYVRCLCKQWTHGSIPSDLKVLARMIHCDRSELESCWPVLGPKFIVQPDGTLKNSKLEGVRERQELVSMARSRAGKAGAIAKANATANASTKEKQRKVKEKEKENTEVEVKGIAPEIELVYPTFEQWWELYDKSRDLQACKVKWSALSQAIREKIMIHTAAYVKAQPDKLYRKDPIRYLTKQAWNDEIVAPKADSATAKMKATIMDRENPGPGLREFMTQKAKGNAA